MGRRLGNDKPRIEFTHYPMVRLNTNDDGIEYVLAYEDETLPRKDYETKEVLKDAKGKVRTVTRLVGIVTRVKGNPEKVVGDGEWVPVQVGDVIEERAGGRHRYNPDHETHQGWNPGKREVEGGYGIGDVVKHTILWEKVLDANGKVETVRMGGQSIDKERKVSRYEVRAPKSEAELAAQALAEEIDATLTAEHEAAAAAGTDTESNGNGADATDERVPANVGGGFSSSWDDEEPF